MKTEIEKILHRHHTNQLNTDNAINEVLRLFDVSGNEALRVAVDFAEIERLIEEYKKEELPNANEPFHYEAEAAAGFKYFIQWLKRKSAKATDR